MVTVLDARLAMTPLVQWTMGDGCKSRKFSKETKWPAGLPVGLALQGHHNLVSLAWASVLRRHYIDTLASRFRSWSIMRITQLEARGLVEE